MINQFIRFCQDSYQELKLSSWLTRVQMVQSTVVVVVLTLLVAVYVGMIDWVLRYFAKILFRIG